MFETSEIPKPLGKSARDKIKDKLLDTLDPLLRIFSDTKGITLDDRDLHTRHIEAVNLSMEAGLFFSGLIPKGLRKPTNLKVPTPGAFNSIMEEEPSHKNALHSDEIRQLSRREYKKRRPKLIEKSLHGRERTARTGEVIEYFDDEGNKIEEVTHIYEQDGSKNLIYERVTKKTLKSTNETETTSSLVIQDKETGTTLDLNALMPRDYKLVPGYVPLVEWERDYFKLEGITSDLKTYDIKAQKETFGVYDVNRSIRYGDITKKGNLLSLFHEIAHSWQYHYFGTDISSLNSKFKHLEELIADLEIQKDNPESIAKIWAYLESQNITSSNKNGSPDPAIEEDVFNFPNRSAIQYEFYSKQDPNSKPIYPAAVQGESFPEFLQRVRTNKRYFAIKGNSLSEAVNTHILTERDAWSNAIRMMQFLNSHGITVEPELTHLKDLKDIIDPCLDTYQKHLENRITMNPYYKYRYIKT